MMLESHAATWGIAALATFGVIVRMRWRPPARGWTFISS
jgi:hypothetical protein